MILSDTHFFFNAWIFCSLHFNLLPVFFKLFQRQPQYFLHNYLWNLLDHRVCDYRKAPALAFDISHKGTFTQVAHVASAFRKRGGLNTGQNQRGKRKVLPKCCAISLPLNYSCKKGLCRDLRWSDSVLSATQDLKHELSGSRTSVLTLHGPLLSYFIPVMHQGKGKSLTDTEQ